MVLLEKHNEAMRDILGSLDIVSMKKLVDLDAFDSVLREYLTIDEMREAGSFFTGQSLASETVSAFSVPITFGSVVLDPTCGAGNLLIECSRKLGVETTLSATLKRWGKVLWGFDIYAHFIEASKLRLVVEALNRGVKQDCDLEDAIELLPQIRVQDAQKVDSKALQRVTHAIMNPPFTIGPSPKENYWKDGKVNSAGVMFDKYLRLLPRSCNISAILPEVLRSGSRYQPFREFVSSQMSAVCSVWGRFNSKTDVDVFILSGSSIETSKLICWYKHQEESSRILDYFDVRTGPLVAYRDPEKGTEYPYFYPKNCPNWESLTKATEFRCYSGKAIMPPFIVVKRTSSPSDRFRASATLINLKEPVAIENHMIVIKPKNGKVSICKKLLLTLKSNETNEFLNERIRLRHLTVGVIKDIPFMKA
jgi:hypothetical protein